MRLVLTASYELKLMKCLSSQHGASPSAVTAVIVVWPAWNVEPAIVVSTPVNSSLRTRRHGRQRWLGGESREGRRLWLCAQVLKVRHPLLVLRKHNQSASESREQPNR